MGLKEIICFSLLVACASASYYYSCPTLFNFYPDSNDCTKFYRCVWGKPVRFSCGPGTRWNQHLLTCDHAYKVPCGYQDGGYQNGGHAVAETYNPEPVYPSNNNYYQPSQHADTPYVPSIPNSHAVEPDYYQYVDNYRYGGEQYPSHNNNNNNHGYHKK